MPFRQREKGSGSAVTVPSHTRIQDGDGTTLADVLPAVVNLYDYGKAKGTQSGTVLQDTDKTWTVDALIGKTVSIHTEAATMESHTITDNDANTITVTAWTANPVDGVTEYRVEDTQNALAVKITEGTISVGEMNVENMGTDIGNYKSTAPALEDGQDAQVILSQYAFPVVGKADTTQSSETVTWNADGTMATYAETVNGKTFTRTPVWNADGTLASSSVAVT